MDIANILFLVSGRMDTVVNTPKKSYDWTFTPKAYCGDILKVVKEEHGEELVESVRILLGTTLLSISLDFPCFTRMMLRES